MNVVLTPHISVHVSCLGRALSMASQGLRHFVDWEEQFVSHDRGSRVVHYYLKDRHGQNSLAVVGTERSLRHMVYVVCDDFLPLAGLDKTATSAFKWRARREVVEWLQTLLTKTRSASSEQYLSSGIFCLFFSLDCLDRNFLVEIEGKALLHVPVLQRYS